MREYIMLASAVEGSKFDQKYSKLTLANVYFIIIIALSTIFEGITLYYVYETVAREDKDEAFADLYAFTGIGSSILLLLLFIGLSCSTWRLLSFIKSA